MLGLHFQGLSSQSAVFSRHFRARVRLLSRENSLHGYYSPLLLYYKQLWGKLAKDIDILWLVFIVSSYIKIAASIHAHDSHKQKDRF